ncbi:M23 family metallopeptidase [Roseisolibacter sp. H3M3-2]|uniref:M23 family metallopeptidase n=1 Tax=Roseisolibacter sp. H3M3-2 TaxID=3031323 RepID=UPI0023DC8827|nr:M23 family metallopeptidase [Roseisolibacter sp. H3M3-2]MDF1505392.1 M23 family metallopeptidase [Roseisolibacter sp. H3M3-2]
MTPRRRPPGRLRATTYLVVGGAAAVAAYLTPEPPAPTRPVAEALVASPRVEEAPMAPVWRSRVDTLARGETLVSLLRRAGVSADHASRAAQEAGDLDLRRLRAGLTVTTSGMSTDTVPQEIAFQPAVDRVVKLRYLEGAWKAIEERLAWTTDTVAARGVIASSLYETLHTALGGTLPAAKRSELVWKLADLFEYRVDMSRDLQRGDSVGLLLERRVAPDGTAREARILAAALTVDGKPVEAIRFGTRGGVADFYDATGKSLKAAFLRAPLEFRRVSSAFGMRRHPILGILKAHRGTDYAASSGTPVRAIGEGTVIKAGWAGGYGNVLEIRHRNGYVSRYGHLRGFAKNVRPGRSVVIGQTVAFVGSTGLSTAPHLHFEVLVGGRQQDPRVALRDKSGWPIAPREKGAFTALRQRLLAQIDARGAGAPSLASAED